MATFFIDRSQMNEDEIRIEGELYHHLVNVLRFRVGDEVHCSNGQTACIDGHIIAIDKKELVISVDRRGELHGEPPVSVTLLQCLPRGNKMDLIVRQTTELGVSAIISVESENSQIRLKGKGTEKARRWQKVADAAAEQCGRGRIPEVYPPCSLKQALDMLEQDTEIVFCYERETSVGLKEKLRRVQSASLAVIIGPEGGFSPQEAELILDRGGVSVTMGPRILRTETAGTAALVAIMYELGDWGDTD